MQSKLFLGPPGCGKTTTLIDIVRQELARGVRPSEIAFVTFTKRGVEQGKEAAREAFQLDPKRELPWFRTLHSLSYAQLGVARDEVMSDFEWAEFSRYAGYPLTGKYALDDNLSYVPADKLGDAMLRIIEFAAATEMTLWDAYQLLDASDGIAWHEMKLFDACYRKYKQESGKLDFSDMLLRYAATGAPLDVKVAIIDEAQDLTRVQWHVAERAFANVERRYIAGDDDQSIYKWAGADITTFLNLDAERTILSQSKRLLPEIQSYAERITARIKHRYAKPFHPKAGTGVVDLHASLDELDFAAGEWFILARNGYRLSAVETMLRERGVLYSTRGGPSVSAATVNALFTYENLRSGKQPDMSAKEACAVAKLLDVPVPTLRESERVPLSAVQKDRPCVIWHEAMHGMLPEQRDYLVACLRNREKLLKPPRITLSTIHGVKGDEREHVALLSDISAKTDASMLADPDSEHRVFYVGCTRAKQSLHIIEPHSDRYYEMPTL